MDSRHRKAYRMKKKQTVGIYVVGNGREIKNVECTNGDIKICGDDKPVMRRIQAKKGNMRNRCV